MLRKDFRELSSFLGSSSMSGRENVHETAPDPLLSTFICNVPFSDPKCNQEDGRSSTIAASTTSDVPRRTKFFWYLVFYRRSLVYNKLYKSDRKSAISGAYWRVALIRTSRWRWSNINPST